MRRFVLVAATAAVLATGTAQSVGSPSAGAAQPSAADSRSDVPAAHVHSERTCRRVPAAGHATCLARVVVSPDGRPATTTAPDGFGPSDLRSAYGLTSASGAGTTVAIVDAYDDPHAASDLDTYRRRFGLPACTATSGCFRKVSQTGSTSYPAKNPGWATEESLDVDMVSATCPDCRILLVEARSSSLTDLAKAEDYAAAQGVTAISNSYAGADSAPSDAYDHPGIAITASAGDDGYGVGSPASYDTVVAVGGTSLIRSGSGYTQKAWTDSGSGCSTRNVKPSWQTAATKCAGKAVSDVSAVADPKTGVAVYDSVSYQGASGWQVYGGTSASSPIIAAVYAMAGNLSGYPGRYTWTHAAQLHDVTSGSNGSCRTAVWCTAGKGWDGPTGLGTPDGLAGF